MIEWIQLNQMIAWWLLAVSVISFVAAMIGVPLWVVSIPSDYFSATAHKRNRMVALGGSQMLLAIGRNLLGAILVFIGILMLVLPGQGLLTIVIGIMLMDLPGKHKIVLRIVGHPPVLHSMNWIRRKAGREPLIVEG